MGIPTVTYVAEYCFQFIDYLLFPAINFSFTLTSIMASISVSSPSHAILMALSDPQHDMDIVLMVTVELLQCLLIGTMAVAHRFCILVYIVVFIIKRNEKSVEKIRQIVLGTCQPI